MHANNVSGGTKNLTAEQIDAIDRGEPVHESVQGREVVVLGVKLFERLQDFLSGKGLSREEVASLIARNMVDLDTDDPTLDGYQIYRQ